MNDPMKHWLRICNLSELPQDKAVAVNVANQNLVIARVDNEVFVLQGYCTHMLFPLAGSEINHDDCSLTCSLHHSKFDVRDGTVKEWSTYPPLVGPTLAGIRERKALRTYETRVENGEVQLLWSTPTPDRVKVKIRF